MITLPDLINLAIYLTLHQKNSEDTLKFTFEIHHLILYIT